MEDETKTLAEELNEYLEENSLELRDIDLDNKEIDVIKNDPIQLSQFYTKYFCEFRKAFNICKLRGIAQYIKMHQDIFNNILRRSSYKNSKMEFGKSRKIKMLNDYVVLKYSNISDFVDLYLEVKG